MDATVKPERQVTNNVLRPKRADSQPTGAVMIAAATMYDVSTQVIWSGAAPNVPCM